MRFVTILAVLAAMLALVNGQLTYNQQFMLKHESSGKYCALDMDGGSNPLRCDYLVGSASLLTLTGNNSPLILNNSYIVNNSIPAILNGGAPGRWCMASIKSAYDGYNNVYCSSSANLPFFQLRKRQDLGGIGDSYLWPGDLVNLAFVRTVSGVTTTRYCEVDSSIIHCDASTSGSQGTYRLLY